MPELLIPLEVESDTPETSPSLLHPVKLIGSTRKDTRRRKRTFFIISVINYLKWMYGFTYDDQFITDALVLPAIPTVTLVMHSER